MNSIVSAKTASLKDLDEAIRPTDEIKSSVDCKKTSEEEIKKLVDEFMETPEGQKLTSEIIDDYAEYTTLKSD